MRMHQALIAAAGAMLLSGGCSYLPSWSVGPPYGDALEVAHHAADPAPSERIAEPVVVDGFDTHERCLGELAALIGGDIVHVSPAEARGYRREGERIDEYSCAGGTLQRRSWGGAAHH